MNKRKKINKKGDGIKKISSVKKEILGKNCEVGLKIKDL